MLKEKDYIFFWKGKYFDELRECGVGFVVKNSLLSMVELDGEGLEWFFIFCLNIIIGLIIFVSVYVLILMLFLEIKDLFYEKLLLVIRNIFDKE